MSRFTLKQDADLDGTFLLAKVVVPPKWLVTRFGQPADGDGYKVSGVYAFVDEKGSLFSVYDWKRTNLFEDLAISGANCDVPTPEEFWASDNSTEFQIGGRQGQGDVEMFKRWLLDQLNGSA
jgi:hypothetical protein